MRVFSDFDRGFINNIINLDLAGEKLLYVNKFLKGLIKTESSVQIYGRGSKYILQDNETHYHKIELISTKESKADDYFKFTSAFYAANDLLDYLVSKGYLLKHEGSAFPGIYINGVPSDDSSLIKTDVYINKTLEVFLEKLLYNYIPTAALYDLARNKFRTKEERHSRATRRIAVGSAIITIIGLLLNYYLNKDKGADHKPQTIIIDTISLNKILNKESKLVLDTNSIKFMLKRLIKEEKRSKNVAQPKVETK